MWECNDSAVAGITANAWVIDGPCSLYLSLSPTPSRSLSARIDQLVCAREPDRKEKKTPLLLITQKAVRVLSLLMETSPLFCDTVLKNEGCSQDL